MSATIILVAASVGCYHHVMRYTAALVLATWAIVLATFWTFVMATGGWYDYRLTFGAESRQAMEVQRCELVAAGDTKFFRCPRFHVP